MKSRAPDSRKKTDAEDQSMFRRTKAVVGLDIGSSAVKAVELKPAGKGFRVAAFGSEPVPPDAIVDGAIIDAGAVADAIRRVFEHNKAFKSQGRLRLALGQRRDRQEDHAAGDDRVGAGRVDLLGGRAVHPVRHPGRQPRLPDSRSPAPAPTRAAAWKCCSSRRRRKRSATTPASSRRPAARR